LRRSGYQFVLGQRLGLVCLAFAGLAQPAAARSSGQTTSSTSIAQSSITQSSGGSLQPSADSDMPAALIRSVRVIPGQDGAAIEILATRPLTPAITSVENPLRLVVDLPKSLVASRMHISYRDAQVQGVRVDQFHQDPPAVRVVIDLSKGASSSWDAAGNRLMIRLHPPRDTPASAPAPEQDTTQSTTVSEGDSIDGGILILAGRRLVSGSAVSAGAETAVLHVGKGGEVRVCPGTTVSVTSSPNGDGVMLGMSTGSLETHYRLESSADSVLTPDFRILFAGPGEFDYAVSADSRGNTCVRALPGNTSSAVVSELIGDGVYQVKPSEEVVFRSGQLSKVDSKVPEDCGCRAASLPVLRAAAENQPADKNEDKDTETARLPALSSKDVHIQVDAPLVFQAADRASPVSPVADANLPLAGRPHNDALLVTALPPGRTSASSAQASHQGFFGKIRGFFGSIFR